MNLLHIVLCTLVVMPTCIYIQIVSPNAQVMLFVERNKLPGLKRLLEAGGATVVTRITTTVLKEVTHAFIVMAQFPKEV